MSEWREEALKYLPQYEALIEEAGTISYFWIELWFEFRDAYQQNPINEQIIAGVYDFAAWCWHGSDFKGNHIEMITTVFGSFYEHLPADPVRRHDMARWLCLDEFEVLQYGPFRYYLNADEHKIMIAEFRAAKAKGFYPNPVRCGKLKISL